MRLCVQAISRKNLTPDKPNEDAYTYDAERGIFCLADGITRSRDAAGSYPQPSSATIAAGILANEALRFLQACHLAGQPSATIAQRLRDAFAAANIAIARYTATQPQPNFIDHDYPGTVGTLLVVQDSQAIWAHLGDTVLLQLCTDGTNRILTRDQVQVVDRWLFAEGVRWPPDERLVRVRRDIRNNPAAQAGFGALTGEAAALAFVETGTTKIAPGDELALLTDGFDSVWIESGKNLREQNMVPERLAALLRNGALEELVSETAAADVALGSRSDDKTAILVTYLE